MKMSAMFPRLLALILLGLPVPALGQAPTAAAPTPGERVAVAGGAYWSITVPELQSMLVEKDFPLINVHVPFQGDLPGTDLSIPFDQIADHLGELPADKDAPVVLYCRNGPMGVRASTALAGLGYTRVYNLAGGFNAWGAAGLPIVNP